MDARRERARQLMAGFAARGTRYLWTDAFAVCNYLDLGEPDAARRLIADVHRTLAHHRGDDDRTGWLPGASDAHPTAGGLRIGKPLRERAPGDAFDQQLEWERDGQYFHYLTKWIHALHRAGETAWATELAVRAFEAFVRGDRMVWKLSIDLTRPLVPSMGHHDPLDGLVAYRELHAPELEPAIAAFRRMIDTQGSLATSDPLGLGGLLVAAARLPRRDPLFERVLADALRGLDRVALDGSLAFRELGLAIGLHAMRDEPRLAHHISLATDIETYWLREGWTEHVDINDVMLATSLLH